MNTQNSGVTAFPQSFADRPGARERFSLAGSSPRGEFPSGLVAGSATQMAAVISISRLAAMTGASHRALRHYESVGLLAPVRTRAGGRLFTPDQCDDAQMIVLLRKLDIPIVEIARLLDRRRTVSERQSATHDVLELKAAELADNLERIHMAMKQIAPATPDRRKSAR